MKKQTLELDNPVKLVEWKKLDAVHDENLTEPAGLDRRSALKLMGASAALAVGIPGCKRKPERKIISRHSGPEYQKPGKSLFYSSPWTEGFYPYGTIVKVVDGRPIKIEGNPDHPVNGSVTNAAMQASILSLYDPDRMKGSGWAEADKQIIAALKSSKSTVLLTRSSLGPSERLLVEEFIGAQSNAKHFVYESIHDKPRRDAWTKVFGGDGELVADYSEAEIIFSLGCDFLGTEPLAVESTRQFAQGRNVAEEGTHAKMNRLYVAEAAMTVTGSNADHRVRVKPSETLALVQALRKAVAGHSKELEALAGGDILKALASDLSSHHGTSVVVAGGHLPEAVHAAVALLNEELGNIGETLSWNSSPASLPVSDVADIAKAIEGGVDVLICLGVNPVYDWAGGGFESLLTKAKLSVGHGMYANETVSACTIGLASSHNLESWNDAVARAGVESICQPVIHPLFDSRQEAESLLIWAKGLGNKIKAKDWHDFVAKQWLARNGAWEDSLRSGVAIGKDKSGKASLDKSAAEGLASQSLPAAGAFELLVLPDGGVYDGRFSNNSWLQETPDPVTRLVWDNAVMVSAATAKKLGVSEGELASGDVVGDMVEIKVGGGAVALGVLIVPGVADGVVVTTSGYGRTKAGHIGGDGTNRVGYNVASLIGTDSGGRVSFSAAVSKSSGGYALVRTQKEFDMHDRPIALDGTLAEFKAQPDFVDHRRHIPEHVDIYAGHDYSTGYQWAMNIDMNKCTGCQGCVTACQAENNIPVVGKDECANGREMHWMRIDRYHVGDEENPTVHQQPMLCQHCEDAPCESVCPVNATSHSPEGLNDMVYNRCVGTRYCANNCPYKVRRFNFFDYQKREIKKPWSLIRK